MQAIKAVQNLDVQMFVSFEDHYFQQFIAATTSEGILLAGPVQISDITFEKMNYILTTHAHSLDEQATMRHHFESTSKLSMTQFKYMKLFLENIDHLAYEVTDFSALQKTESVFFQTKGSADKEKSPHHPLTMELDFLQTMKKGDRSALDQLIQFDQFSVPNIGNGDPVRSYKNVIISAVAVSIRDVADVVLDFNRLQRFSDEYINKVE